MIVFEAIARDLREFPRRVREYGVREAAVITAVELRYWGYYRAKEKLLMGLVWHLPRTVVHWAYIRVAAHATTGQFSGTVVPELSMMDALQRWEQR